MSLGLGFIRASAKLKLKPHGSLINFSLSPRNVLISRNLSFESRRNDISNSHHQLLVDKFNILSSLNKFNSVKEQFKLPSFNNRTLELPTVNKNLPLVAYIDQLAIVEKIDPLVSDKIINDNKVIIRKEAAKMIRIRRRKMRVHKRKKFLKKFRFLLEKVKYRREKKKEKLFQAELLGQIKEAEMFNAEKYVHDILKTIRERPRPETPQERFDRIRELRIKNRSNVNVIRPKFEED